MFILSFSYQIVACLHYALICGCCKLWFFMLKLDFQLLYIEQNYRKTFEKANNFVRIFYTTELYII